MSFSDSDLPREQIPVPRPPGKGQLCHSQFQGSLQLSPAAVPSPAHFTAIISLSLHLPFPRADGLIRVHSVPHRHLLKLTRIHRRLLHQIKEHTASPEKVFLKSIPATLLPCISWEVSPREKHLSPGTSDSSGLEGEKRGETHAWM